MRNQRRHRDAWDVKHGRDTKRSWSRESSVRFQQSAVVEVRACESVGSLRCRTASFLVVALARVLTDIGSSRCFFNMLTRHRHPAYFLLYTLHHYETTDSRSQQYHRQKYKLCCCCCRHMLNSCFKSPRINDFQLKSSLVWVFSVELRTFVQQFLSILINLDYCTSSQLVVKFLRKGLFRSKIAIDVYNVCVWAFTLNRYRAMGLLITNAKNRKI